MDPRLASKPGTRTWGTGTLKLGAIFPSGYTDELSRRPHALPYQLIHPLLYFLILLARGRAGKAGENRMHMAGAVEEDGRGKRAEALQLWKRFLNLPLVRRSRQQQREGYAELSAIDFNLFQIARRVVRVLIRQADDLQTLVVIFLIELLKHRRFVVAVGTPRPKDVDDERLAGEFRTGLIQRLAGP